MSIFNETVSKMIEYAIIFERIEPDRSTAGMIYQEAVKNVAYDKAIDILEFFYGYDVYEKINTAKSALECICVATELKPFYEKIQDIGSMNDKTNTWAKYSDLRDQSYKKFFLWLANRDKTPNINDLSMIKIISEKLNHGSMSNYKISSAFLKDCRFCDLVERICRQEISVSIDGDLR